DGGDGVNDHRSDDVRMHHANPAPRAMAPFGRSVTTPGEPRIAFLDAPVWIHKQLARAHAGDAEYRDGVGEARARQFEFEAVPKSLPRKILRHSDEQQSGQKS